MFDLEEILDSAVTGLRDPMTLDDAYRVRGMLTHHFVALKKEKVRVERLGRLEGPEFQIVSPRGELIGTMQVKWKDGVFATTIKLAFSDMQASEDLFNYLVRQGFPGYSVVLK